jgi:sulfite reductase (NADPH) flavoprotein alpha-component
LRVLLLIISQDPQRAARVFFTPSAKQHAVNFAATDEPSYMDPATGRLLGRATGERFFDFCESLHRWLALPRRDNGPGRIITGVAALSMIYFACSGLYLRWPRKPLDWRQWLRLDFNKTGSRFYRALHSFVGTWVLMVYLFSASTGLWWAFSWYQQLAGWALQAHATPPNLDFVSPAGQSAPALNAAWQRYRLLAQDKYATTLLRVPQAAEPIRISAFIAGRSDTAMDEFIFDQHSGNLLTTDLYARRRAGDVLAKSTVYVHRGSLFGLPGRIVVFLSAVTLPLFPITGLLMYRARRR